MAVLQSFAGGTMLTRLQVAWGHGQRRLYSKCSSLLCLSSLDGSDGFQILGVLGPWRRGVLPRRFSFASHFIALTPSPSRTTVPAIEFFSSIIPHHLDLARHANKNKIVIISAWLFQRRSYLGSFIIPRTRGGHLHLNNATKHQN